MMVTGINIFLRNCKQIVDLMIHEMNSPLNILLGLYETKYKQHSVKKTNWVGLHMFIVNCANVNLVSQTLILFIIAFPHENTVNTVTKYHTLKQEYLSRYNTPLRIRFERFLHL